MCGIAGCVGHEGATEYVTDSLEILENRGYDSIGLAYPDSDAFSVIRSIDGVNDLRAQMPTDANQATTAIGHTRWATHGKRARYNAHPHTNEAGTIAVVHNGTIENHTGLRERLTAEGYQFSSETDTEVIPHLLDYYLQQGNSPAEAFEKTIRQLVGAYGILACFSDEPDTLHAAKLGSSLVLGVNHKEHFAASEQSVLPAQDGKRRVITLDDYEIAELSPSGYRSHHIKRGMDTTREPELLTDDSDNKANLGDFPHFMIKEIHDSPETIRAAISGRVVPERNLVKLGGLEAKREELKRTERIVIVGCGTSYHAGLVGKRLIEEIAGVPVEVELASEFKYGKEPYDQNTAIIALSQSGETADTIGALEKAHDLGMLKLGVVNTPGSRINQITDAGVHGRAGKEVSVASTKAFTSQVTVLAEIALALAQKRNELYGPVMNELVELPQKVEQILASADKIKEVAEKYAQARNFLYIGRGYEYPTAIEGALKLKEVSYIHAEGYAAGEMKHGTLALIDEQFPTMAIATDGSLYEKMLSNIEEIRARGGPVIALATEGNQAINNLVDDVIYVPKSVEQTQPIINSIALQLFAYYAALKKGLNVDRPRNLAKSVTVE